MPFESIGLFFVIICSIGIGLYVYRFILVAIDSKKKDDDDLEERTAKLLERYRNDQSDTD